VVAVVNARERLEKAIADRLWDDLGTMETSSAKDFAATCADAVLAVLPELLTDRTFSLAVTSRTAPWITQSDVDAVLYYAAEALTKDPS
jgi:hypothetical protein